MGVNRIIGTPDEAWRLSLLVAAMTRVMRSLDTTLVCQSLGKILEIGNFDHTCTIAIAFLVGHTIT